MMSALRGDAEARLAERRRAIIAVFRVAARRRHLAGCQTRWGPPSNSSRQNKGSVRNTGSCNISPGPGSHPIRPAEPGNGPVAATWINILGVIAPSCCHSWSFGWREWWREWMQRKVETFRLGLFMCRSVCTSVYRTKFRCNWLSTV